jgi:hypothetical protein
MSTAPVIPKLAKVVAWFAIAYGILTLLAVFVGPLVIDRSVSLLTSGEWTVIGVLSIIGGWFGLKGREWALVLVAYVFVIQIAEYSSPSFAVSFIGPISMKFGWVWYSPPVYFKVNVLAITVCVLSFVAARGLTSRSSGRPVGGTSCPPPGAA